MQTINIHEAKTHLSRLVEQAAKGESFVIAKAGKPMVKVVALSDDDAAKPRPSPFGFMPDMPEPPADFDRMFEDEIAEMFGMNG